MRPFVHPQMMKRLDSRFFPEVATIQVQSAGRSPTGEKTFTWANVDGLTNLPSRSAPMSPVMQTRGALGVVVPETTTMKQVVLQGDFPQIKPATHRLVLDGIIYDIKGVDREEGVITVLEVELLTLAGVNR